MTTLQDIRMAICGSRGLGPKERAAENARIYTLLHLFEHEALKGDTPLCEIQEVRRLIPDYAPRP